MAGALQGLPITLGGQAYTMPCINAATSRLYWQRIVAMQSGHEPDPLGLVAALVLACLRRNYPQLTEDDVEDHLDLDNLDELSTKVFGAGAWAKWCEAQATSGNPTAPPATAIAGTGAPSTPASPLPPDGA